MVGFFGRRPFLSKNGTSSFFECAQKGLRSWRMSKDDESVNEEEVKGLTVFSFVVLATLSLLRMKKL